MPAQIDPTLESALQRATQAGTTVRVVVGLNAGTTDNTGLAGHFLSIMVRSAAQFSAEDGLYSVHFMDARGNLVVVSAKPALLRWLAEQPDVVAMRPDRQYDLDSSTSAAAPAVEDVQTASQELAAATSVLLDPVLTAGAKLRKELEATGKTEFHLKVGTDWHVTYCLETARAVIRRDRGIRRTKTQRITVLVRNAWPDRHVLAEDPHRIVDLGVGEGLVEVQQRESIGLDETAWGTVPLPSGEQQRAMANEIPKVRAELLAQVRKEVQKAKDGAAALRDTEELG